MREAFTDTQDNIVCQVNQCNGCMACVDRCPKNCITIQDSIFAYNAVKNMDVCINCGQCEKICPNNTVVNKQISISWKQGWAEWNVRSKSSSGGAASAIIKSFIQSGGYVASCLFKDGKFVFELTNDLEVAKRFAGSKYVKSNPTGIYKKIQERLKTDKVLFIGLPCQVAALKNFVKKQDNLYTIDLICHGTPSPKVLEKFLAEKKIKIEECTDIKFRTNTAFGLADGGKTFTPEGTDDYLITFLDSISYTENCYECQFATTDRVSDVTLGDSWGTEYKEEEKNGVSLILIQTEKGRDLVYNAKLEMKNVDLEKARNENHQLRHPSIKKPQREAFLNDIVSGKSFALSTFKLYKKRIIKRNIKKVLVALHLIKVGGVQNNDC